MPGGNVPLRSAKPVASLSRLRPNVGSGRTSAPDSIRHFLHFYHSLLPGGSTAKPHGRTSAPDSIRHFSPFLPFLSPRREYGEAARTAAGGRTSAPKWSAVGSASRASGFHTAFFSIKNLSIPFSRCRVRRSRTEARRAGPPESTRSFCGRAAKDPASPRPGGNFPGITQHTAPGRPLRHKVLRRRVPW